MSKTTIVERETGNEGTRPIVLPRLADDFTPVSHADVESWIKIMSRTPPEALEFISTMIRGQGLKMDQ